MPRTFAHKCHECGWTVIHQIKCVGPCCNSKWVCPLMASLSDHTWYRMIKTWTHCTSLTATACVSLLLSNLYAFLKALCPPWSKASVMVFGFLNCFLHLYLSFWTFVMWLATSHLIIKKAAVGKFQDSREEYKREEQSKIWKLNIQISTAPSMLSLTLNCSTIQKCYIHTPVIDRPEGPQN